MTPDERKNLLRSIRNGLKAVGDFDLEWEELAEKILPAYQSSLAVALQRADGPEGDYAYTLFSKLTAQTFLEAIEIRKAANEQTRVDDLEAKWRVLRPYLLRDETMTVKEAVCLLAASERK